MLLFGLMQRKEGIIKPLDMVSKVLSQDEQRIINALIKEGQFDVSEKAFQNDGVEQGQGP